MNVASWIWKYGNTTAKRTQRIAVNPNPTRTYFTCCLSSGEAKFLCFQIRIATTVGMFRTIQIRKKVNKGVGILHSPHLPTDGRLPPNPQARILRRR